MTIIYTPHFKREYKKLPVSIKQQAEKKEALFRRNPFTPSLKTHQLQGNFKGFWSFSINYHHRIVFEFGKKDTVYFHAAGDHRIYR